MKKSLLLILAATPLCGIIYFVINQPLETSNNLKKNKVTTGVFKSDETMRNSTEKETYSSVDEAISESQRMGNEIDDASARRQEKNNNEEFFTKIGNGFFHKKFPPHLCD